MELNGDPPPLPRKDKRIAVLTSGGDSQGMNGVVRAVIRYAISQGCEAFAVMEGYQGLVDGGDMIKQMYWQDVRGWLSEGGTLIGTQRCEAFRHREGRLQAALHMITKGIDALIVCGGDGSLTGADKFREEWPSLVQELVDKKLTTAEQVGPHKHLVIVGLVGSIDNDLTGTDATIGCYSSLARICQSVDLIDATASSHQRAFVIEVMGRHCGWLALMAGVATGADFIFIPESPPDHGWEEEMCEVIGDHRARGKRKTIVIVAEGAHDRDLHKITPGKIKELLSAKPLNLDTRITTLGHVQRGGNASAYDRMLSTLQGVEAVKAVLESTPETPSPVICIVENKITRKSLLKAVKDTHEVAEAIHAKDFAKAIEMRDAEFAEFHYCYKVTCTHQPGMLLPPEKRRRIGIIHVGAPAGGMNAATRAAVAYCLARGHTPVALHNGFPGLCRHHDDMPIGSVREVEWLDAEGWASKGGSEIGTNRGLPSEDMKTTAYCFEKYKLDALFLVGGFEAFTALSELRKARKEYKAFNIPMCILPATISNNVPGTEYSIGSDTCLNALIDYCDAIRQSASASRRRVFVVETQGGASGYIATLAGLSVGAYAVYTPEEGINIRMLARDIDWLRQSFANDKGQTRAGKIILRNEKASQTYTTEMISNMIKEEAKGRFESRYAVPGHVQQGGTPTPMDRCRAVRFGIRSIQHLETFFEKSREEIAADPLSTAVIGIRGARVKFSPMEKIETEETDWKDRRPKDEFWMSYKSIIDILSGRPKVNEDGRVVTVGRSH